MSFLGLSLLTGIAGLASASARNFRTLVVLRTFPGIGTGVTQLYIPSFMEFVPVANRGTCMIFFFVTSVLGTSICIVPKYSWRWLVGATSLPCVVALVFHYRIPKSPTFLSSQGELTDAYTILEQVAICNNKELPEGQLVYARINDSDDNRVENNDDADGDIPTVPDPDETNRSNTVDIEDVSTINNPLLGNQKLWDPKIKLAISTILSREWRLITCLIWLIYFGNSFLYHGLILLLSPSFT
nr:hypothetical protein [Tanacetum cinerariifolium]